MKKIYTLANMAKGMMLAALLAVGTTALAQNVSGNTESGTVEGNENGSNENETFAPAAESSWLQPVKLVGNGQKAYIYNVATGTFITGKTATVKISRMQTSGRLMAIKPVVSLAITRQKITCSWDISIYFLSTSGMQRFLLTTRELQQILPS